MQTNGDLNPVMRSQNASHGQQVPKILHQPVEARSIPFSYVPIMMPHAPPPSTPLSNPIAGSGGGISNNIGPTGGVDQHQSRPQMTSPSSQSTSSQPVLVDAQQLDSNDNSDRPVVKHRRAPVACRRCRRLRSKCVHDNAKPPCIPCSEAGGAAATECFFPARGEPDNDRSFRRRRIKASEKQTTPSDGNRGVTTSQKSSSGATPTIASSPSYISNEDRWEFLPPLEEVIDGCRVFFTSYFQLGFLPKAMFIEKLQKDKKSVSPFLLLALLGISARFVPKLVKRYGGGVQATDIMIDRARRLVYEEMYQPSLERIQAFFLLGIAEWGNGDKIRSSMHMGIAIRMAGILRLHQEEAYEVAKDATADEVVNSEVARRTFWVLISQESLHSGSTTPAFFSLTDITALLPCDEADFAFGIIPKERAALSGTLAAKYDERLVWLPSRSLFATLIQVHSLWGQCARASTRQSGESPLTKPWQPSSRFAELAFTLQQWEENMPQRHRWSLWNLRGYRSEKLDLAYLAIVMVIRLSNIVIRRLYLEDIMNAKTGQSNDNAPPQFWDQMSIDLFTNVLELHEQVDAFFSLRSSDEGFPAIIVFCIYSCGSLAYYLARWPQLCMPLAMRGTAILERSMEVLTTLSGAWPLAMRWQQALNRVVKRPVGAEKGSLSAQGPPQEQYADPPSDPESQKALPPAPRPQPWPTGSQNLDLLVNAAVQNDQQTQNSNTMDNNHAQHQQGFLNVEYQNPQFASNVAFPIDDFETELNAFLQGGEAASFWNGQIFFDDSLAPDLR